MSASQGELEEVLGFASQYNHSTVTRSRPGSESRGISSGAVVLFTHLSHTIFSAHSPSLSRRAPFPCIPIFSFAYLRSLSLYACLSLMTESWWHAEGCVLLLQLETSSVTGTYLNNGVKADITLERNEGEDTIVRLGYGP